MPYLDHCIETEWTEVTKDFGGGFVRTEHYRATDDLPEWLGDDAELRLSPGLGETGGRILYVELVGVGEEAHAGFKNKRVGEIMPVLRINGVWGRINSIYDPSNPGVKNYNVYVTAEEHAEILAYDGTDLPEEEPRPLSKHMVWVHGRTLYSYNFTHGQRTRWGKEADAYSNAQRSISGMQAQQDVFEQIADRNRRYLASEQSPSERRKLEDRIEDNEANANHLKGQIPGVQLRYAESLAKLEKWEAGEDPDPHLVEVEALMPQVYRLKARIERYERILEEIGPDHEQYDLGVQLTEGLKKDLENLQARIAEIQAGGGEKRSDNRKLKKS